LNPNATQFNELHRRFWRCITWVHRAPLPRKFKRTLASIISERYSPWAYDQGTVAHYFETLLQMSPKDAQTNARRWAQNHGDLALLAYRYDSLDAHWLKTQVDINDRSLFTQVCRDGGIVLTFHTLHHYTLFVALGLGGARQNVVAASESNAPDAHYVRPYMRMLNEGCVAHFGGGRLLFTDQKRVLLEGVDQTINAGYCLGLLCDNPYPHLGLEPIRLFNRQVQIGRGVLKRAKSSGCPPVYAAIMYAKPDGRYQINLTSLGLLVDEQVTLQGYFSFLEEQLQLTPWIWQGWSWLECWPAV